MNRRGLALTAVALVLICFIALVAQGGRRTFVTPVAGQWAPEDFTVTVEREDVIRLEERTVENGALRLTFRALSRGKSFFTVYGPDDLAWSDTIYVHPFGITTVNTFLGAMGGNSVPNLGERLLPIAVALYLALVLWSIIRRYRRDIRESFYRYRNVRNLGWILYVGAMLLIQLPQVFTAGSLLRVIRHALSAASALAWIALPVAFVVSILVAVSNLQLMGREGRNWRNTLGAALGLLVCLGTVLPYALSDFLYRTYALDVNNEGGFSHYAEMIVTNAVLVTVSYLECILWSTVILSLRAAKGTPPFDRDYLLILGCQIRKDGTLTPLLQGRVDRALAFARAQKEAAGKDVIFVPSGGKGDDEVMAEGEAMARYLEAAGIPRAQILPETQSANTEENLRLSQALIHRHTALPEPKLAFSTTNYHVFRAGILAWQQGIRAEGMGSPTRSYFWINALVREFIATVYAERRAHLRVIAAMVALVLSAVGMIYLSNTR